MAKQHLGAIALLVKDYDEAKSYYCDTLSFDLIEDTPMEGDKRWLLVAPANSTGARLLLAKASTPKQMECVGNQAGGRVFLFLHTDDFWGDYARMKDKGVIFCEEPREEPYGTVVIFEDLYGNRWDFLQLAAPPL